MKIVKVSGYENVIGKISLEKDYMRCLTTCFPGVVDFTMFSHPGTKRRHRSISLCQIGNQLIWLKIWMSIVLKTCRTQELKSHGNFLQISTEGLGGQETLVGSESMLGDSEMAIHEVVGTETKLPPTLQKCRKSSGEIHRK